MCCRMIFACRFLAVALVAVAIGSAASPLAAQQPGWPPVEPQAESLLSPPPTTAPLVSPETTSALGAPQAATAPSPDRRLMRQVYTTRDGTYHLNLGRGTAHVQLGGKHWLVPLQFEKYDLDHDGWRYRVYRHDRSAWPCYVWGFGMDRIGCQGYAVWTGYQPAQGAKCVWLMYRWGSRVVTQQGDPVPPVPAPPE